MTPAISSIDSERVSLGDLADYSITSAAIPVDVADSSGAITSFTTKHAIDAGDNTSSYYAIGQNLSLQTDDAGQFVGKVTAVGSPVRGAMSLTAETVMARLAVDKRVYPIYNSTGIPKHLVGAALDHWTQTTGMFYDQVPGKVITYHSFYGHDYIYSTRPEQRPRAQVLSALGAQYRVDKERVLLDMPRGSATMLNTATVQPSDALIAPTDNLPIPSADSGENLVLSAGFVANGSHSGTLTWYMASARADQPAALPVQLELAFSTAAGFSLHLRHPQPGGTSYTLVSPSGALTPGARYRVLIAMHEYGNGNGIDTLFRLRVINEDTGVSTTRPVYAPTPLRGTQVQLTYAHVMMGSTGTGNNWGMYGYFVSTMKHEELPDAVLPTTKNFAPTKRDLALIPGFNGDLWSHAKELLALHRMDLWYENGRLHTGLRETAPKPVYALSNVQPSLSQRESAKFIEVVNHRMKAHSKVPRVFFAADSVYQVATGEVQTFTIQTDHSIDTVNNPACVSGITPYPYTEGVGQYVITGSDGYIVAPGWWEANGGRITVKTTEREGEIEVTIKGPDYDSPRSPFRVSEGDAGRPALYITGTGIIGEPETLKIPTGNSKAVTDVGETVDTPFITDRGLAYQAAVQVSLRYASPELKLSASEVKEDGAAHQLSLRGAGALVEYAGNMYRIGNLTRTGRSNSFSDAVQYTTIRHRLEAFPGRTIRQANEANAGRTIKDRALRPLERG